MRLLALFAILFSLLAAPVLAVSDDTIREAIYRVNLGRADDVALLLKEGVSPDQVNQDGTPLLALAAARADSEGINVMKTLLDAGANINATDMDGRNALFYAAKAGNKNAALFLMERNINYYAVDHAGNIARTIAHNEGHKDLVKAMDDFVTGQTQKVQAQYQEFNKAIETNYKTIQEQNAERLKQAEEAQRAAARPVMPPPVQPAPATTEESPEESPEDWNDYADEETGGSPDEEDIEEKRASPQFRNEMREMAFNSCAFQYWSFCRLARQTTDLSPDELNGAIDTHRRRILDQQEHLAKEYKLGNRYISKIENRAKQNVSDQLNAMPSKTYRFEHGVCKMDDMNTRCGLIADAWDQEHPVYKRGKSGRDGARRSQTNTSDLFPTRAKGEPALGGQPARAKSGLGGQKKGGKKALKKNRNKQKNQFNPY